MIKCPNCQGEMEFDSKTGRINCHYCKNSYDPEVLKQEVKVSTERKETDTYEGKSYTCSQCGATLLTFDETAITFCSYCGSQAMLEDKLLKLNNPDCIIPFSISKEECIANYKKEISKSIFAPEYLKDDKTIEKFRSIYMPYCIYKLEKKDKEINTVAKYSHREGSYNIYDKYNIECDVDVCYDGISFDLLSKFYDKYSSKIPYNYKEAKKFNSNYLIGHYVDAIDVNSSVYDKQIEQIVKEDSENRLKKYHEFKKYGCMTPRINLTISERKKGLYPVYFLANRNKNSKLINYAIVNGQTGKVVMDIPISFTKYIIFSLITSIIIFLIINSFLFLTPRRVSIFFLLAALLSFTLSNMQAERIKKIENNIDDKGYISVNRNKKSEMISRFKYIYASTIAFLFALLPLSSHNANDMYYYVTSIMSLLFLINSFKDIINEYNILISNKLPQLEKRGGDENE